MPLNSPPAGFLHHCWQSQVPRRLHLRGCGCLGHDLRLHGRRASYTGLVLARFFIGFVEAVFFPGSLYYMSLFYSRNPYALRVAILYSGSQLGNAFGGLFAIGILNLMESMDYGGWRWVSDHSNVLRNSRLMLQYQ